MSSQHPVSLIRERAKNKKRTVVLPEGNEPRTLQAAKKLISDGIASVILLGDQTEIAQHAKQCGLQLGKIEIIDPKQSPDANTYAAELYSIRKAKGMSESQAATVIEHPLYFGAMLVRHGKADGAVAGAVNSTGDVLRAALQVIGMQAGVTTVSSSFIMTLPKFGEQHNKPFLFADCAVLPNPNPEQLAAIAVSTAQTMRLLLNDEPRIALLSFSTKGSASHPDVDKVLAAFKLLQQDHPDLQVDAELQLDAAVVPEIARRKAPSSDVAGKANILIFPDLDSGNIGYKLVERFAGATATGPIIQGLARPFNDLSRGCSADDIVDTVAIAMLMKGA